VVERDAFRLLATGPSAPLRLREPTPVRPAVGCALSRRTRWRLVPETEPPAAPCAEDVRDPPGLGAEFGASGAPAHVVGSPGLEPLARAPGQTRMVPGRFIGKRPAPASTVSPLSCPNAASPAARRREKLGPALAPVSGRRAARDGTYPIAAYHLHITNTRALGLPVMGLTPPREGADSRRHPRFGEPPRFGRGIVLLDRYARRLSLWYPRRASPRTGGGQAPRGRGQPRAPPAARLRDQTRG
jgi:hypothetical protein